MTQTAPSPTGTHSGSMPGDNTLPRQQTPILILDSNNELTEDEQSETKEPELSAPAEAPIARRPSACIRGQKAPLPTNNVPRSSSHYFPQYNPSVHPPLPTEANLHNFLRDYQDAQDINIRDEFHRSDRANSIHIVTKCRIARARLMIGKYGMDPIKPCLRCKSLGRKCRVFHPLVYTWNRRKSGVRFKEGGAPCAWCTYQSGFCNAECEVG